MRFTRTFYYSFSLFIAGCIFVAFLTNENMTTMSLIEKTYIILLTIYCCTAMIFVPKLHEKGIITRNYHTADKVAQAKARFVINSVFLPFWLSIIVGILISSGINLKTILVSSIFIIAYLNSAIILIRNRKKTT